MTITLGQMKQDVLTIVNKTAANKGFYTDDKMELGFRDGMAMVATRMFIGGQGWQARVKEMAVPANAVSVDIPKDVSFINNIRYLVGNVFYPMTYDTQQGAPQVQPGTGVNVCPATYRILNDAIWFNPALSESSTLQFEYTTYMRTPQSDADAMPRQFDISMVQFLIYHCASFVVSSVGKASPEWGRWETHWYQEMLQVISKRNNQPTFIKDFDS
jgi:hypothetical protein